MVKKIISSSFWLLVGNSIGRLSMFLANIFAARLLSQDSFGQFSMVRSTISMIEGLISGTLGSPSIKLIAESSQNKNDFSKVIKLLFIINISIIIALSVFIVVLAPFIVDKFFIGQKDMVIGLYIGSSILITTTLSGLIQNIFIGIEEYQKLAKSSIYISLLSFPFIFIFINYFGLNGALFGVVLYFSVDFLIKYIIFKRIRVLTTDTISYQFLNREIKRLLVFSYPLLGSVILSSLSFWYARVMIVQKDGFSSIAIFDAAYQWLTIIMIITGATTSIVLPMLSKNITKEKEFNKILLVNIFVNLSITVLFALIFIFFSKDIMSLYGEDYINGSKALQILSITAIFFSFSSIMNKVFISKSKTKDVFYISLISSVFMFLFLKLDLFNGFLALANAFLSFYLLNFVLFISFYLFRIQR